MDDTELVKEITDWNFRSENKRTTEDQMERQSNKLFKEKEADKLETTRQ